MTTLLSLGWGVQSTTMAFMALMGEIQCDLIVHADTTFEASHTYRYAERWGREIQKKFTYKVVQPTERARYPFFVPLYTKNIKGENGVMRRICTNRWKIIPIRKEHKKGTALLGISMDEIQRMRPSRDPRITNSYPLIDRRMSRSDCIKWLQEKGIEIPQKSACYFCPYHSLEEWKKVLSGDDREKAIEFDGSIRYPVMTNCKKKELMFEHFCSNRRVPLEDLDLRSPEEKGQLSLWENECEGICGI